MELLKCFNTFLIFLKSCFLFFFSLQILQAPSLTLDDEPHSSDILNDCIEESLENDTASEQEPTSPSNQLDYTSTDPGCWGCIKAAAREYWIEKGPLICQNRNALEIRKTVQTPEMEFF